MMQYKIDFVQFEKEYLELRTQGKSHEDVLRILTEKYGSKENED
jgi:cytochrome c-type biogenesis protein CcmH/NrfF